MAVREAVVRLGDLSVAQVMTDSQRADDETETEE
jgi:hypothetical protein